MFTYNLIYALLLFFFNPVFYREDQAPDGGVPVIYNVACLFYKIHLMIVPTLCYIVYIVT